MRGIQPILTQTQKKKQIAPTVSQQVSQCLLDHFIHFSPIKIYGNGEIPDPLKTCWRSQTVIQWLVNPRTHHQPTIIYRLVICLYLLLSPYFDGFFLTPKNNYEVPPGKLT